MEKLYTVDSVCMADQYTHFLFIYLPLSFISLPPEWFPSCHPEDPLCHVQPSLHPHLHLTVSGFHWVSEPLLLLLVTETCLQPWRLSAMFSDPHRKIQLYPKWHSMSQKVGKGLRSSNDISIFIDNLAMLIDKWFVNGFACGKMWCIELNGGY